RIGDGVCDRIENHLRRICNINVSGSSILLSKTVARYLSDSLPVRSCCPFRLRSFGGTLDGAHVDGVWKPAFSPVWNDLSEPSGSSYGRRRHTLATEKRCGVHPLAILAFFRHHSW